MSKLRTFLVVIPVALLLGCDRPSPVAPGAELAATEATAFARGPNSQGMLRTTWPTGTDPGAPFYARIEPAPPHVHTDGGWAAIPFYRDPDCLLANRPGFDLLEFFDVPFAFACDMTVHGSTLWHGSVSNGSPHTVITHGDGAVPVWFVPEQEIVAAMADGELTIVELAALPGLLVGHATRFQETLHPHPLPPMAGGGGHPVPKILLNAAGVLEDGRRFDVHITSVADQTRSVRIRFR